MSVAILPGIERACAIAAEASPSHRLRRMGAPDPMTQGPCKTLDIRRKRRIVFQMRRGVVADDVDHAGSGFTRIVDIGKTIRQPGPRCSNVEAG